MLPDIISDDVKFWTAFEIKCQGEIENL